MDPTQTGGGLSFANALGISFSQSQIRGAGGAGGSNIDVFSTVTLLLNGNTLTAEPGDSSVDIGASITGQNVQYISQMAGTTMINSPTMINGNLALPHQYNFSMNPEQSATLPTATINADINVGTPTVNPSIMLYPASFNIAKGDTTFSGDSFGVTCPVIGLSASNVTFNTSNVTINTSSIITTASSITTNTPTATTNTTTAQTNTTIYVLSSQTAYISSDQNLSISTNSGSINMNAASNVNINSSGSNVNIESYYITNVKGSDVNVVGDSGLSLFNTPIVNVKAGPGGPLGGRVNIDAFASYGEVAGYGLVSINAHGSVNNPAVPIGGSVEINAFSAGLNTFAGATSAIRLNSATININAGAIPSFPTLAGSMVMFGNNIVSICAGSPAVLPQIPLTTYIYGLGGVRLDCGTGARITTLGILQAPDCEFDIISANSNSNFGVYFTDPITANVITPQPSPFVRNGGGDLYIRGSNIPFYNSYVQIQDVGSLAFATAYNTSNVRGAITGLSTINGQGVGEFGGSSWSLYNQISTLSSITANSGSISSLTVSSFNGTPFAPWYNVPAAGPVQMNQNSINNASYIITSNFYTTELNGQYTGADMGKLTMKASTLSIIASTISMLNLSTVNGNSYIDTRSWATVPATVGIDANGKNVGNVGTIFANDVVVGNSIVFTNPDGIIDINDNALINVSSIQASAGNAISFANAGLINVSTINGATFPQTAITGNSIITSSLTVSSIAGIFGGAVNMVNTTINQLAGLFSASVNTPLLTNTGTDGPIQIYDVSGVIVGGGTGTGPVSLINLSSINGVSYPLAVQTADSLIVSSITVSSINAIFGGTVNMSNTIINQLAGLFSASVNTPILTNVGIAGTPLSIYDTDGVIVGGGTGPVSLVNLSSINGVAYTGGASWNGNATSGLNMNQYAIANAAAVGVTGTVTTGAVNALANINSPQYYGTNATLTGAITIGGTTLDSGGLGANGITLATYANIPALQAVQSINGESYVNPFKIVAPNFAIPYSGYTVTINTGNLAGYWYFTGASDITIHIQFQAPAPPPGGSGYYFNGSFGGRYTFFNQNPVNNMYIYASVYYTGPDYPAGTIQINPREGLTLEVVPYGASSSYPSSSQASWNKIGFIHYEKVGPIVPAS